MKRILSILLCVVLLSFPGTLWAVAGSCTQTPQEFTGDMIRIKFVCTGDSTDGSIPNTALTAAHRDLIYGYYLYTVTAYPTSGGTAPDAADVFILNARGEDLLGSVDGGTTANKGLNLIHATLTKTTMPYSHYLSTHYFPAVTDNLTLKVSSQATVSAHYTIELLFAR